MELEKLNQANGLQQAINAIKQILAGIERLVGLTKAQKDNIKENLQVHHDDLQKSFDEL